MTNKTLATITIILVCNLLTACGGAFSDYNDAELRSAFRECDYSKLSAAGAQRCNNIKKECDARRKNSGFRC